MKTLTFTLLLLVALPALAWDEPTEFRGVPFGATLEQARAVLGPMKCERYITVDEVETCRTITKS